MFRLQDHYLIADGLKNDIYEVFFQFTEEEKDLHPEDWEAMEKAWERHDLRIEILTDAGLVAGMLKRRFTQFDRRKRFEIRGHLVPSPNRPQS